jgi:hypothetical protein
MPKYVVRFNPDFPNSQLIQWGEPTEDKKEALDRLQTALKSRYGNNCKNDDAMPDEVIRVVPIKRAQYGDGKFCYLILGCVSIVKSKAEERQERIDALTTERSKLQGQLKSVNEELSVLILERFQDGTIPRMTETEIEKLKHWAHDGCFKIPSRW